MIKSLANPWMITIGEDAAKDALSALLGGGAISFASVGAGLLVGVTLYAAERGLATRRRARTSPDLWLTKMHGAGATPLQTLLWESRMAPPPPGDWSQSDRTHS
jgi:hypothetical protein